MTAGGEFEVRTFDEACAMLRRVGIEAGQVVGVFPWAYSLVVVEDLPSEMPDGVDVLDDVADLLAEHVPTEAGTWYVITSTSAGDLRGIERTGGRSC